MKILLLMLLFVHSPNPTELAHTLTIDATTQTDKAHVLYNWIIDNIKYDKAIYTKKEQVVSEPNAVLEVKKTSCLGYAMLFQRMCMAEGIKTKIVYGYAKGIGSPYQKHAWNLVYLNNKWIIVDVTWGSTFKTDFYFNADKELFKYTHFALNTTDQLTNPLSLKEFMEQDGSKGDEDPFWRNYNKNIENGTYKKFNL